MKKVLIAIIILANTSICFSQTIKRETPMSKNTRNENCRKYYINLSGGINNPTSFPGLDFEYCINDKFSAFAGLGGIPLGSWGAKFSIGGRYYTKPCHMGWAFGGGITRNFGSPAGAFVLDVPNSNNSSENSIELYLNPILSANACGYRFWNIGKKGNRFYIQLGANINFTDKSKWYSIKSSTSPISNTEKKFIELLAPGPIVTGMGFSFGL
jgi:hypothetical protein